MDAVEVESRARLAFVRLEKTEGNLQRAFKDFRRAEAARSGDQEQYKLLVSEHGHDYYSKLDVRCERAEEEFSKARSEFAEAESEYKALSGEDFVFKG